MSNVKETIYRAELILIDGRFEEDALLIVEGDRIKEVVTGGSDGRSGDDVVDLGKVALVPGQINVHSHSFQRSLRGKTEYRDPLRASDDFWTWRREMYALANRIDPEEMEIIARTAFWEMARSGITHVGEFHYVHHRPDGRPYDEPNELALRIEAAAGEVGIRLTLLPVAYHTGDIGEPSRPEQRRFIDPDVETYLARVTALQESLASSPLTNVGMAPHSIRAVPRSWMEAIAEKARSVKDSAEGMPVHIHVCEQRREVEASKSAYGAPPIEALSQWGVLDASWTLIHGTHLSEAELDILEEVRPTIGACPTTERNLGDGFLPARQLLARGVPIALGSDSHTVIDPFEEMRLVEYHERLRKEERNVLVAVDPEKRMNTAEILWPMGTTCGARSLGSDDGELKGGALADFVALDLEHPSLVGATRESLLTDVVLSMSSGAVRHVVIGGRSIVDAGRHKDEQEIVEEYRALMKRYAENSPRN